MKGRLLKRFLSLTLTLSMLMSSIQPAAYAAQQAAEEEAFIEAQEEALEEELRDMVGDEEYPEGVIEFAKTLNEVAEDEEDTIMVVREGNNDSESSVVFKAVDVSASYGKDYTLSVVNGDGDEATETVLDENPDAVPLVQEDAEVMAKEEAGLSVEEEVQLDDVAEEEVSAVEESVESEESAASETDSVDTSSEGGEADKDEDESVVSEESDVLGEVAAPEGYEESDDAMADDAQVEAVIEEQHEEVSGAESDGADDADYEAVTESVHEEVSGVEEDDTLAEDVEEEDKERELPYNRSGLANAYKAQMGEDAPERDWREYSPDEVDPEYKEAMAEGESETIEAMKETPGVAVTLTFAPGEYKKEIKIRPVADGVAESDEVIAFLLYDEKGASLGANYHGYINIRDIDEKEDNIFSVKEKEVKVHIGESEARVTIVREGGIEQMATVTVGTKGETAVSGEDYTPFNQELYFAPGITERELVIPITGIRDEEKSFWVGIRSDREKVIEESNAALVTIESLKDAFDESVNGDAPSNAPVSIEEDVNGDATYEYNYDRKNHVVGTMKETTLKSGLNLVGAKSVTIKFSMNGDTYIPIFPNAKGKKATVTIRSGNGQSISKTKTTDKEEDSFTITFENDDWKDYTNASINAECWGTGCNKNSNTFYNIKDKIRVVYPEITFKVNNGNSTNEFVEKTYTQSNKSKSHDPIYYGMASFSPTSKDEDSLKTNVGNNVQVYFHYGIQGNSVGVKPSESTVEVKGYKLKKNTGSNKWSTEILKPLFTVDTHWVNAHSKDYKQSDGSYILMPVVEPRKVKVTFKNPDGNKGNYKGYSDNESFLVNRLDTLEITSATRAGWSMSAIELKSGNYTATTVNQADKNKLVTGFGGASSSSATVNLVYDETHLRVLADPLYKGKESVKQGKVLYVDEESKKNYVGDYQNVIDIPGVSLHKTYNIVGITDLSADSTGKSSGESSYRVAWRDATLDDDEDGVMSEDPSYDSFKAVRGNVLPYVMKRPTGRVYYNFEPKAEASNPADIEGFLKLQDEFLISHKQIERGLNGAQVVCNYNDAVTANGKSKDKRLSGDGYFRIASGEFNPYNAYLVNLNYDGAEGSINVGAPIYPADCTNIVVKAQDDLNIRDVALYKHTKEWKTMTQEKDKWEQVKPKDFYGGYFIDFTVGTDPTNTDKDKAYRIEMTADNSGVETVEGSMQFYDGDKAIGDPVKGEALAKGTGRFRFEFKPDAMGLKPGVTARVKFKDAQGHEYLEREVGLKLVQAVGTLTLLNEFAMGLGGVNIDFLSNVDSRFSMGWVGGFDEFEMAGDGSGDKVLTIGIGHQICEKDADNKKSKLQESAEDLVKADEEIGEKHQAYEKAKKDNDGSDKKKEAYKKAKKEYEDAKNVRKDKEEEYEKQADETYKNGPEKKTTKIGGKLEISLGVRLVVTYAFDGEQNRYYFKSMMLTAKLTIKGSADIKFQLPWGFTVNIGIAAGGDIGASFIVKQDLSNQIAAKKNRKYAGAKDEEKFFIWTDDSLVREGNLNIAPYITLTVGAGALMGALKAEISGTAAFDLNFYSGDTEHKGTVTLSAKVSAEVLFVFKFEKKIAEKQYTLFGPDDDEEEDGALGAAFDSALSELQEEDLLGESADTLQLADFSYMKGGSTWKSKAEVEKAFEDEELNGSLDEDSEAYSEATIADKIVENPEFEVVNIGNRKYAAVFTNVPADRVGDAKNARAAYYTIYDNGWSVPKLLEEENGGMDAYPRIFRLKEEPGAKGAIIIWSTVEEAYMKEEDINKRQHGMNLHARFLNTDTGKCEDEIIEVTKSTEDVNAIAANAVSANSLPDFSDYSQDVAQNVAVNSRGFIVYYEKKEFKQSASETVGDVVNPVYDLFAARYYDYDYGWDVGRRPAEMDEWKEYIEEEFKDDYNLNEDQVRERAEAYADCFYGQRFFEFLPSVTIDEELDSSGYWKEGTAPVIKERSVNTGSKRAPVILDSDAISCDDIGLFAYSMDMDGDTKSYSDREICMQMYDFNDRKFTSPMVISSNKDEDCNVKFAKTDDAIWLCYLSDGDIVAVDISNVVKNKLYIKGKTHDGKYYYYIDKSAPEDENKGYVPEFTLVEGKKAEVDDRINTDEIASNISSFDVESSGKYMYVMWSQTVLGVKKDVEEDSFEAALPENASKEEQLFTLRFSGYGDKSELTYPVQITSKTGAHYRNPAFALTPEGGLIGLSYRAMDKVVGYDEFTDQSDGFARKYIVVDEKGNESEKNDLSEEDYVPITVMDNEKGVPVAFKVDPAGRVKIKDAQFSSAEAGSRGGFNFRILNDGFTAQKDLRVKAVDEEGNSVLLDPDYVEGEGEPSEDDFGLHYTDEVSIDKLIGGEDLILNGVVTIPENANVTKAYISVVDKDGDVIAEEIITEELKSHLDVSGLTVENTGERNEYRVSGEIVNTGNAKSKAQSVDIGIDVNGDEYELSQVRVTALAPEQRQAFETVIHVEDTDFTESTDDDGTLTETLTVFVEPGDEFFHATTDRTAYASELERIAAIKNVTYKGTDTIGVNAGGTVHVVPEIISDRKNADGDGTEGLQYFFVNPDPDDDGYTVDPDGTITGLGEGDGLLDMYVLPANRDFVAERRDSGISGVIGAHDSLWPDVASAAIYKKTFMVSVAAEKVDDDGSDKPRFNDKKGVMYQVVSGNEVEVIGVNPLFKNGTKVKVPTAIKVEKTKYNVVGIADGAFEKNTLITKVSMGSNVRYVGKRAFAGCTSIKSLKLSKNLITIKEGAFEGCTLIKKISLPKKLQYVEKDAFSGCTGVKKITLDKALISIGDRAFKGCALVKKLTFPAALTSIGASAFEGLTNLQSIKVQTGVINHIGDDAFRGVPAGVKITVKVKNGDAGAFTKLFNLSSVSSNSAK